MEAKRQYRQALRQEMVDQRASLTPVEVSDYSRLIAGKLSQLEPLINARSIMGFDSISNEVDLRLFLEEQANRGKTVLLPRVESNGALAAIEFTGWQNTRPGAFNIREPIGIEFSATDIDMVIVPGLVFDGHGFRLGYGKGYYDRYLQRLSKNTFICGVCYDFQVVDSVCPHAGDIPVHWIVTEKSELVANWDFF